MHEKRSTNVQMIMRDGQVEYAVLPWADYQALLRAAGWEGGEVSEAPGRPMAAPSLAELATLREAQNMSQEQLARAVGISPSYLDMIETGERQPDSAIQRALARALGIVEWEVDS
ncbi:MULTISPECIES: helix-turn-helix domain-containing protein [Azotobacter]|nr:helix-turn-helix transcriptional regulator [Azotobacter vinelandii]SFX24108.1 Helix-turn-helix [Azotobacter vinelandii]